MKKRNLLVTGIISAAAGAFGMNLLKNEQQTQIAKKTEKFRDYYNVLNQWIYLKNHDIPLARYFEKHKYHNIAIYGMGEMGNRLYEELSKTDIKIEYGIDKSLENTYSEIKMISLGRDLPKVDAIVVTPIFDFDAIEESLAEYADCPIISFEEVIYEI